MLETIIPYLTNLTDKVLKAAFGTVTSVLIILTSFTGGNSAGINQSLNIDQKTLKELIILKEEDSNFTGNLKINLPASGFILISSGFF